MSRWDSCDPGAEYYALAKWSNTDLFDLHFGPIGSCTSLGFELVIERPQVYGPTKTRARNKDIVSLAIGAGRISASYTSVRWYLPAQWKGQTPKKVHQKRILLSLTEMEHRLLLEFPKTQQGHLIDAIGLGLVHCGRMHV